MAKTFSIIVTYNGAPWIKKCLGHLFESNFKSEIRIIDNASTDNTLKLLEPYKDSIYLIENKENLGFGQANNLGIEYAMDNGADFIFLLNQDAYVFPVTISKLTESFKKNPSFCLLSPLQLEVSGKAIEPIFNNFLRKNFSKEIIEKMFPVKEDFESGKAYAMRFVNALARMITRKRIIKTGLFHPVFFHYGEENHYATRVQYQGMKIGVLPSAHVIHDCKIEIADSQSL